MERWRNRIAVVTGASSGIGAACVKLIVAAGIQVVGLARRIERMEELRNSLTAEQQTRFHLRQCDVSQEQQVKNAFEWVEKQFGGIDILVNNAGIVREGNLIEMPLQEVHDVVNTNFMAAIYCLQSAVKSMRERQFAGHLIFISSSAGLPGYITDPSEPSLNIYTPTKLGLSGIYEICRQELMSLKTKIKTTNICPGWVDTEIVSDEAREQLGEVILQADDVANAVMYALSTPAHTQVQQITLRAVGEWF